MGVDPLSAALLGGAVSGIGSFFGNQTAAQASEQATALQRQIYNENTANLTPYMQAGAGALGTYQNAIGMNGTAAQQAYYNGAGNVNNNPGYNAALNAGNTAIMKNAAALGLSGPQANTMFDIGNYGGQLTNTYQQQQLNELAGMVNTGQSAASALAGVGTQAGANMANSTIQGGILQGASYNALGQSVNQGINNYLTYAARSQGGNNLNNPAVSASPVYYGPTQ